uniref:CHM Rab escort protein n=1 Tax=Neogobius melanostomus TaxID=47308 RepID=A0A8C6SHY0_9GOBI
VGLGYDCYVTVLLMCSSLCESVVAAACSRVGQRVLHLDRRSFYAGDWASFTFNGLLSWIKEQQLHDWSSLLEEGEELVPLNQSYSSISDLQVLCYAQSQSEPGTQTESQSEQKRPTLAGLVRDGRRFNIDLVSKLLFSRGSLVDLLIQSNVSRYAEFKNVSRILTFSTETTCVSLKVPCSRADVFSSRQLSVVDKRKLMKFLTSCLDENDPYTGESSQSQPRHAHGGGAGLHAALLRCLGRYGNTPFLFPVYGLGEIPQCFCRMSAVFGGVYCLRHSVHGLVIKITERPLFEAVTSRLSVTDLVHLTCPSTGSAHHDLFPVVTSLFVTPESPDCDGPVVLWSLYFNMAAAPEVEGQELPVNVHLSSAPDAALGHDATVAQAERIFNNIVPGEEFCPPAPNPEDIIYGETENTADSPAIDPENAADSPAIDPENTSYRSCPSSTKVLESSSVLGS